MIEILCNICLFLKISTPDLIVAISSLFVSILATYITYKINRKIENFDNHQYIFAKDLLKEILPIFYKVCDSYINKQSINNSIIYIFPTETILVIMNLATQNKKLLDLKISLSGLIMHINKSNYLIQQINQSEDIFKLKFLQKELKISLNILKDSITEFQEKFLR